MSQTTVLIASLLFFSSAVLSSPLTNRDHALRRIFPRASTTSKKAGLAWPNGNSLDMTQFAQTGSKVSWYYTWSPYSVNTAPQQLEFVPMLWGTNQVPDFQNTVAASIQAGSKHVLGMFEPDQASGSSLSPQAGANMWQQYLQPLKSTYPDVRLGTPAISSSGKPWLQAFLGYCNNNCSVDFIALHWYGVDATAFIQYITDIHTTFNLPIWVTEWACQNYSDPNAQCTQQQVIDFLRATQNFMDNTEWVERYAYYGVMMDLGGVNPYNSMVDSRGAINPLGAQYIYNGDSCLVLSNGNTITSPCSSLVYSCINESSDWVTNPWSKKSCVAAATCAGVGNLISFSHCEGYNVPAATTLPNLDYNLYASVVGSCAWATGGCPITPQNYIDMIFSSYTSGWPESGQWVVDHWWNPIVQWAATGSSIPYTNFNDWLHYS